MDIVIVVLLIIAGYLVNGAVYLAYKDNFETQETGDPIDGVFRWSRKWLRFIPFSFAVVLTVIILGLIALILVVGAVLAVIGTVDSIRGE